MIDFMGNFKKVNHNLIPLASENNFFSFIKKWFDIAYFFTLFYKILQVLKFENVGDREM